MQIIGNIIIIILILSGVSLFKMLYLDKPIGGDAAVGQAYVVVFLAVVVFISLNLLYGIIGLKGGFSWLATEEYRRPGILFLIYIVMAIGLVSGTVGNFRLIHFLGPIASFITVFLLTLVAIILLNEKYRWENSAIHLRWIFVFLFFLNAFVVSAVTINYIYKTVMPYIPRNSDTLSSFEEGMLEHVNKLDSITEIVSLYSYADKNKHKIIRERAQAKIKSNPEWEKVLLQHLEGDGMVEAFGFLEATEVSDKALFAKSVYKGVLLHAEWFRRRLRECWHPSHVRDGMFYFDIRLVLNVVEKFNHQGVDFVPAIKELRAALDEKIEFPNPNVSDKKLLDKWIQKHEGEK